jgi:hypothetical protein
VAKYKFKSKVWKYKGAAGWYFVSLPKALSKKIRTQHGLSEEGWGRLKTAAQLGTSQWTTAIWFDTKSNCYLLPIKALVRKKEKIEIDSNVNVILQMEPEEDMKLIKRFVGNRF